LKDDVGGGSSTPSDVRPNSRLKKAIQASREKKEGNGVLNRGVPKTRKACTLNFPSGKNTLYDPGGVHRKEVN